MTIGRCWLQERPCLQTHKTNHVSCHSNNTLRRAFLCPNRKCNSRIWSSKMRIRIKMHTCQTFLTWWMNCTFLSQDTNCTFLSQDTNCTFLSQDTNCTFLSQDTNCTFLSRDTNCTFLSRDTNCTFLSRDTNSSITDSHDKMKSQTQQKFMDVKSLTKRKTYFQIPAVVMFEQKFSLRNESVFI